MQSQSQSQSDSVEESSLEGEATLELIPESTPPAPAPGEILRQAREERGESLNDIARILKLSAQQLEALENGRHDILPGPTFVRGFLRNYAQYLGIPPEPLLEGISARTPTAADLASMLKLDGNVQPAASPRPRSGVLPVVLIILVVLVLAGLVGATVYKRWFKFSLESPAAAPVQEKTVWFEPQIIKLAQPVPVNIAPESANPPPQVEGEQKTVPTEGSTSAQAQNPPMPVVPEVATLRVSFNASTLAQVRDSSGKLIFTRTGAKGSSSSVKGKPPFSVMVKQANNVKLEYNGQSVDLKGHTNRDGIARLTLQ